MVVCRLARLLLGLVALSTIPLPGQTTVYLPPVGAITCAVMNASSATPSEVTVSRCSGKLAGGMPVAIYGTIYQTAGFAANGLRRVSSVSGSKITITDINGNNVAGPANFSCLPIRTYNQALFPRQTCARLVQLQSYTAKTHPRVHGLDGASGALTASIAATCPTCKAHPADPAYAYIANVVPQNYDPTNSFYYGRYNSIAASGGAWGAVDALYWNATGDVNALTAAKYYIGTDSQGRGFSEIGYNTFGCTESAKAFCDGRYEASDYPALWVQNAALDYSLIRGQLSRAERQKFSDLVLNDRDREHNGLGMRTGPRQGCTNNSGVQFTGVTVDRAAITCTNCLSEAVAGGTLKVAGEETFVRIATIKDNNSGTAAVCARNCVTTGISNATMYYYRPWQTGDCGFTFFKRHATYTSGFSQGNAALYPPDGGTLGFIYGNNGYSIRQGFINLYLALADDDPRAVEGLAWQTAQYYDLDLQWFKNQWAGPSTTNHDYQMDRTLWHILLINVTLRNGITNGPDYNTGIYESRIVPYLYMQLLPFDNTAVWQYSDVSTGFALIDRLHSRPVPILTYLFSGTVEAQRLWYWYKSIIDFWTRGNMYVEYVPFQYIFQDPAQNTTDFSGAPNQYLFNTTDADSPECSTTYNYGLDCDVTQRTARMISTTGMPANNKGSADTSVFFSAASYKTNDHTSCCQAGMLHIAKDATFNTGTAHGWLLSGDSAGGAMASRQQDDSFQFGGSDAASWKNDGVDKFWSTLLRWAGTNPTGDAQSRYAYVAYELKDNYRTALHLITAQRHIAHMKKSGQQDYVVQYDYTASSSPTSKRTFLHFWCPRQVGNCNVNFTGPGDGATVTSKPSPTSMINTRILSPVGVKNYVYTDKADGSYPGGNGYSFRISVCAGNGACDSTNITSEWIMVHQPAAHNWAVMPTITQGVDTTGNFRLVEVQDATSPKVIAIGRRGGTYAGVRFTTTHAVTAQYLVAGLAPGKYNVWKNGSIFLSNQAVSQGDNTLYFESGSGTFRVLSTSD